MPMKKCLDDVHPWLTRRGRDRDEDDEDRDEPELARARAPRKEARFSFDEPQEPSR